MVVAGKKPSSEFDVEGLKGSFRGDVILPGDGEYDSARSVFNAMIDRRPAAIAHCADVADVIHAVKFARNEGLRVAVRGGGHSAPGLSVCDDGLVIDLSRLNGVRVDPDSRTVRVEGGATWGKVDHATHAFGLATVSGIISTTGVAGLTLGGGHGHLTRQFGLTIDNLLEADVVLADGRLVTTSKEQHPDLFWALRGGGGNFGIVTSFNFRLHPVSNVVAGPTLWELDKAPELMRWYREFLPNAPTELNGFFALMTVPPGPPFPEELHLKKMCGIVWCYTGSADSADEVFAPVKSFESPALHGVHMLPYPMLQGAFDALYPKGLQSYWRGDFVDEIRDEAIEQHLRFGRELPSMQSTMHLYPIDGAVHEVREDETAFSYRNATWSEVIVGADPDPASASRLREWTVRYWEAVHPYAAEGAYVNFMMDEGQERVQATYRGNYPRLANVKAQYDPDNFFQVNQNIRPAK